MLLWHAVLPGVALYFGQWRRSDGVAQNSISFSRGLKTARAEAQFFNVVSSCAGANAANGGQARPLNGGEVSNCFLRLRFGRFLGF